MKTSFKEWLLNTLIESRRCLRCGNRCGDNSYCSKCKRIIKYENGSG